MEATLSVKATCTGCLSLACALDPVLAHSPSPGEGGVGWGGGGAVVSCPRIHCDAEELAPRWEGWGRGWCEWTRGSLRGRQSWAQRWRWCLGRSYEPGCSELSWALSSTCGGRTGRGERLTADLRREKEEVKVLVRMKTLQLPEYFSISATQQQKKRMIWRLTDSPCGCSLLSQTYKSNSPSLQHKHKHQSRFTSTPRCDRDVGRWSLTLRWRTGARDHEAGQRDGPGGSALERDGEEAKVTEHVHDRGEAQVLNSTLTPFCEREAQVLQRRRK